MFFGLAIGLSVALAIYVNSRQLRREVIPAADEPASMHAAAESALDNNNEVAAEEETEPRFTFYTGLPKFEVIIPAKEPEVRSDTGPQAVVKPGEYILQAGSFSRHADADRRRAQLAMQGIESHIQPVTLGDKSYHRVRIGPTRDLDELNVLRARLRAAKIDVLRIRLGD